MVLLHGVLNIYVERAEHLPRSIRTQMSSMVKRLVCCGMGPTLYGSCDPYAVLELDGTRRLRTSVKPGETSPEWEEQFEVYVADEAKEMRVVVKDADLVGAEHLAQVTFDAARFLDEEMHTLALNLRDAAGNPIGLKLPGEFLPARIFLSIQFRSVETQKKLVAASNTMQRGEVPHTYFPARVGNKVKFYHDAHQTPGPVPDVLLGDGTPYQEASCWDDVHSAIKGAKRFILITGWSVWVETALTRKPCSPAWSPPLGQLLLAKADEGVKVLLLIWDDATNNIPGTGPGLMATHDNETCEYFNGTKVKCVLAPRKGGGDDSLLQGLTRNTFTHHQKTIAVDAPPPEIVPPQAHRDVRRKRHVVAFVGGLDLCDGRYDTPHHPIFGTDGPGGPHEGDIHQPNIEGLVQERGAPRQPWHDIHSRIEGPAAYDVMINFMERWSKQSGPRRQKDITSLDDCQDVHFTKSLLEYLSKRRAYGRLLSTSAIKSRVLSRPTLNPFAVKMGVIKGHDMGFVLTDPADPNSWRVQVFRSIDSDSARGFGTSKDDTYDAGLGILKGKVVDRSIHTAYVNAIRQAERFIYIENQYFLGSSHLWDGGKEAQATHLVPAELALKICSKIQAREPFRVYVVLPLWPEGIPTAGTTQDILHWQWRTMSMMYTRIAVAIRDAQLQAHPTDFLQFYCLGQRQPVGVYTPLGCTEAEPPAPAPMQKEASFGRRGGKGLPPESAKQAAANASRRFMIYVHSKLMVVDDEYAIVGSANINQRSMDGSRDTEIAMGAMQAGHVLRSPGAPLPRGEVAAFREAVWKEHVGVVLPEAADPSSEECARKLRAIGELNWVAWSRDDTPTVLPHGHLMTYPIAVSPSGAVGALPGVEEFPDLGGRVLGQRSGTLLPVLTT